MKKNLLLSLVLSIGCSLISTAQCTGTFSCNINPTASANGKVIIYRKTTTGAMMDSVGYQTVSTPSFTMAIPDSGRYILKFIPSSPLYQISYSDNKFANKWMSVDDVPKVVERGIMKIFKQKVKVLKHKLIYWENGTHYYKPLPKEFRNRDEFLNICQNPEKNIFCVGEAFSRNQGWSEGALESVLKILSKI